MDAIDIPKLIDFDVNKEECKKELFISRSNSRSELSSTFNIEKKTFGFSAAINTDSAKMGTKLSDGKVKIDFSPKIPNGSLDITAIQDDALKFECQLLQKLKVYDASFDIIGNYKDNAANVSFKGKTKIDNTDFELSFPEKPKLTISTKNSNFKFNAEVSKKSFYTLAFKYGLLNFGIVHKGEFNLGASLIAPSWNFSTNYNLSQNKLGGAFQIARNSSAMKMNTEVNIADLSTKWGFGVNYDITPFTSFYSKMSDDLCPLFGLKRKFLGTDLSMQMQIVKSKPTFGASLKIKC